MVSNRTTELERLDVHRTLARGINSVFDNVVIELPVTLFDQSEGVPMAEPPEAATNLKKKYHKCLGDSSSGLVTY